MPPQRDAVTAALQRLRTTGGVLRGGLPGNWTVDAACRGSNPNEWMDDRPDLPTPAARAVCAACPVRAACLAHALAHDKSWGMWGGLTTRERVAHRLGLPVRPAPDEDRPSVGTYGARATKPKAQRRAS